MDKQIKFYSQFEVKQIGESMDEPVIITGYANTVSKDRYNDVIPSYAWNEAALENYKKNPIILAFHEHDKPIGVATELVADEKGLKITAKISKAAQEVYQLIKDGVLRSFSVGFLLKDADYDQVSDIFVIKALELLEVSVVSVPANQDSIFDLAKSFSSEEEYLNFKKSFITASNEGSETQPETAGTQETSNEGEKEFNMDKTEFEQMIKSAVESAQATGIQLGQSGAERLLADIQKRVEDGEKTLAQALDGLVVN